MLGAYSLTVFPHLGKVHLCNYYILILPSSAVSRTRLEGLYNHSKWKSHVCHHRRVLTWMAFGLVSTGLWSTIALCIYKYLYAIPIALLRISIIIIQIILMSIGVGIVSRHHWTRRQLNLINMKTWKSWCLFLIPLFSGIANLANLHHQK